MLYEIQCYQYCTRTQNVDTMSVFSKSRRFKSWMVIFYGVEQCRLQWGYGNHVDKGADTQFFSLYFHVWHR